jgi:tetratricopeptide (TPR) repeat protein
MGVASRDAPGRAPDETSRAGLSLVGRGRELDEIAGALEDAISGRGRLVLLVGEPGIGKTRLADEASRLAARRSVPVLWGRSWEAGGAPAYWPWLDVLANVIDRLDEPALRDCLGEGEPLVAALVPRLRSRLGSTTGAPEPPSPEEARFRLWRALNALVRQAAAPDGLMIVLDDLHSADEASLALLQFMAREVRSTRLLLLATYRDVEARLSRGAGELIGRISREGTTLALARLDREAAALLLRQRAPDLEPAVEKRIFDSAQGNPLFLQEMSRLVGEQGAAALAAGALPEGVREVIRQRLDRLAPEARRLLDLAAVAGDEIDVALLAAASGRAPAAVTDDLQAALRAGVLVERNGRRRFSHDLVREVLYGALDRSQRQAMHGAVAAELEKLRAADPVPPLAELAFHGFAGPVEGIERAVDYAVRASQRSLGLAAYEEALAVLERAAAAVESVGNPPALRARVLAALAEARIRRGEISLGQTLCRQVAILARSLGDNALLARATLSYGLVVTPAIVDPVLVQMLEESLEALPAEDSALRVQLMARLGSAMQPMQTTLEPVRIVREAIEMARRLGDPATLLGALVGGMGAMMDVAPPRERLTLNLQAAVLAVQMGDRERLLRTHSRLALDHVELGEWSAADARIDDFEKLATEMSAPWYLWRAPLLRAMRALIHGRFQEAETLADQAFRIGRASGDHVERCLALHREGQLRAAERHEELISSSTINRQYWSQFGTQGAAWVWISPAHALSRAEDAAATARNLARVPEGWLPTGDNVYALFYAAEPVALAGSLPDAERVYAMLAPAADREVLLGMTQVLWEGPVARLLGLLAARLGRWPEAIAHFEAAIERTRQLDAGPYHCRTRYEYARALQQRAQPGDHDRARRLLEETRPDAERLQLAGLLRLIDLRLSQLPAASTTRAGTAAAAAPSTVAAPNIVPGTAGSSADVPPSSAASTRAAAATPFSLVSEGEYWAISYQGHTFRLKDSLGLRYLERLIAQPDREIHVLDLAGGRDASGSETTAAVDAGDSGELLDPEAKESYRRRLEDLREELAEAESAGDTFRVTRAREEIEFLGTELSRAVGLGGRGRRAGGAAERARSAVQRRIRNALDRIADHAPALTAYLEQTIKTGTFCVYRPGPGG